MSLRIATGLAVLTLTAGAVDAQTATSAFSFSRADSASDAGARGIVSGDFDNDGAPDFATANTSTNTVDVFMNREFAGGGFVVARYPVGAGPFDLSSADFNFDGYPDLVVAAADADEIDVLFGGPGGVFKPARRIAAPGNPRGVATGWLGTGQGGYSIVYTSYTQGSVSVLNYDYNTDAFVPGGTLKAGANPQGVAIASLKANGGYPDIAVANAGGSPITLLLNNGDGTFTRSTLAGATNLNVLVSADFNHDGKADLAAASTSQNFVVLYLNSSSGLHLTKTFTGSMIASPRGLAAADLTADGHPELLVANRSSSSVTVFVADAADATVFSTFQSVPSGSGARAVGAADFDGDGRVDVATGNDLAKAATVLWNRTTVSGRGTGATAWELRALPDATPGDWAKGGPFAVADFNNNGVADIVVADGIVLDGATARTIDLGRLYPTIDAAVVGDFNEDGHTDIAQFESFYEQSGTVWTSRFTLDVLLGDGNGGFRLGTSVPLGYGYGLAAADVNGDGHVDIVVFDVSEPSETRRTLLGKGDGSFTEIDHAGAPYEFLRAAVDMNGDGNVDLVVWNPWTQQIGVYPGDGRGGFGTQLAAPPLSNLGSLQVADLNGDGRPDAIAIRHSSLVTWLGRGDGTFGDPIFTDLPNFPYNIVVADLTGDGHPDVLTSEGTLAVGRGDGTFGPNRTVNITFTAALAADIDRDGLSDLFIGTYYYTAMALYNKTTEPPNAAPVLKVTPTDLTFAFQDQFGEEGPVISASRSYDPNLDPLSFVWSENDQVIATGTSLYLNLSSGVHHITLVVRDNAGAEQQQVLSVTIKPYEEIVAHMGYMASPYGAWVQQQDATAPDGYVWHPNAYAAKVATPLANPTNFVTLSFPADPTQEYKLWIRLRAQGDDPYNDSVYVQFDGAVDASGAPAYQVGTTSALAVNLEECSGCGLSGWGWRDEAWGTKGAIGSVTLRFPPGANNLMWHYMKIQTREDGVMIDQVILSATKYKSTRPGTVKNDTTIVPITIPWD